MCQSHTKHSLFFRYLWSVRNAKHLVSTVSDFHNSFIPRSALDSSLNTCTPFITYHTYASETLVFTKLFGKLVLVLHVFAFQPSKVPTNCIFSACRIVITLVRNNDPEATKNGKPRAVRY